MAVEAQSLAHITTLASNPPLYPRNPTEQKRPPLTLYIVRVPGSRDVFLTPLRPREKVVNAQDVQSSLYFLHVDDLRDTPRPLTQPLAERKFSGESALSKRLSRASTISRKPLPTPPASPDDGCFAFDLPARQPQAQSGRHLSVPPRKPVLPARGCARDISFGQMSASSTFGDAETTANSSTTDHGTSLTLIRRDATTGAQWNVAKIRDPVVEDISSESLRNIDSFGPKAKSSGAPLFLDLSNPGYSKFLHSGHTRSDWRTSVADSSPASDDALSQTNGAFSRRMWLEGCKFSEHSYMHRRSTTQNLLGTASKSSSQLPRNILPAIDKRGKSYTFMSPWNGRCEFTVGAAGGSLKCRHSVQSTSSHAETTADISELRFNLPTRAPSSSLDLSASTSKRPSYYTHERTRSEPWPESEPHWTSIRDESGGIDYSLGGERAGGGFGGKQAKLGKLIIEDEGQKMLDLVVAANLALWWRAYERTS